MNKKLKNNIESLLFISHKPLSIKELSKSISANLKEVTDVLADLEKEYQAKDGGIVIIKIDDKYQLATSNDSSEAVKKFIKSEVTGELTKPSLETLTIIAYRAPISKAELELIRGVNCSVILRNLLIRGLIEAKEDAKKMTVFYSITFDFLKYLGLKKIEDLPDFEKLNRNNNLDKLLSGINDNKNTGETINSQEISE
ncbi:MAG: SMC-Scp complex subunit ScpB [Candidatus Buchananbacteria bacterium]|nr:SMC-Scp complex subunit ScpB [Candidatus Buchananbacteria bacterium]